MEIEINKKQEDALIKEIEFQEGDSHSGNSADLIMEEKNQKVKILDSNNLNNKNTNNRIKFKKLKNLDSNEIPLKSKK